MSDESICIIFLGALYVYQNYRLSSLERRVFTQLVDIWTFQKDVLSAFKKTIDITIEKQKKDKMKDDE